MVTQPEGKNLIQACLNAPAGQIPTGAPIGQPGASVHQANIHSTQPPQPGPVPATHPASGVPHGLPPPSAMAPPPRNMPGGLSIGQDKRDPDADDDDMEEEDEQRSPTEEPPSPVIPRPHGMGSQRSPPQPPMQRQISHHGAPGQARPTSATTHSARGAHHGAHPYALVSQPVRDPNVGGGHRRRTSSGAAGTQSSVPSGAPGKSTSPRVAMSRQTSNMSNISESNMDVNQSPTMQHYPSDSVYAPYQSQNHGPPPGSEGGPPPGRMMPPYQQQPHPQPGQHPPGSWGNLQQQGVHPGHRR